MPLMEVWNNVPPGSRLKVSLTPSSGFGVTGTHTVNTGNGPVLRGAITSGHFTLDIPVGGEDQHVVDFQLLWMGADGDVRVVARVEDPGGFTFDEEVSDVAALNSGHKVDSVTLIVNG